MPFRICDYKLLAGRWRRYGLPDFKDRFCDYQLTALLGYWMLDVQALDCWLHERYGAYERENKSMLDLVRERLGNDCLNLVEELL